VAAVDLQQVELVAVVATLAVAVKRQLLKMKPKILLGK
jgi:hypothetical protein